MTGLIVGGASTEVQCGRLFFTSEYWDRIVPGEIFGLSRTSSFSFGFSHQEFVDFLRTVAPEDKISEFSLLVFPGAVYSEVYLKMVSHDARFETIRFAVPVEFSNYSDTELVFPSECAATALCWNPLLRAKFLYLTESALLKELEKWTDFSVTRKSGSEVISIKIPGLASFPISFTYSF